MEEKKFVLGQKVKVIDCYEKDLIGKIGYIIDDDIHLYGVEFDEYIGGHDCHGKGTLGCCYYFIKRNLEAVREEQGQLSKFKNVDELQKAYLELEKEFSRRNQAYKELTEEHDQFVEAYNEKIDELKEELAKRDNETLKNMDLEAITKAITVIADTIKEVGKVVGEACKKYIENQVEEIDEDFEKAYIEALYKLKKDGGEDE